MSLRPRLSAPRNYRILRHLASDPTPFLQSELADKTGVSRAHISRFVSWMAEHGHIERGRDARYRPESIGSLVINLLPYERRMDDALAGTLQIRGDEPSLRQALVGQGATLCLESALAEQSGFFRPDRIAVYHDEPDRLIEQLQSEQGGHLPVSVYAPDLPLAGEIENDRRTDRFRTIVDLACDGKTFAARDLIEEQWGIVLG